MKVLLIFRGENQRYRNGAHQPGYDGLIKATDCLDNWNATIFNDLKENNIDYDVIFITYESPILQELIDKIKPIKVITDGPARQVGHLTTASNLMLQEKDNYDKILLLRFDLQYRHKITKWPKWDRPGIILASKDVGWDTNKCYHDFLFIVDASGVNGLRSAIADAIIENEYHNRIGVYLYYNKVPFEVMYEHGYHLLDHPLYVLKHFEEDPDLTNPKPGIIIKVFENKE